MKASARKDRKAAEAAAPVAQARPARAAAKAAAAKMTADEKREAVLKERFCPEGIKYLKDVLGIDLTDRSVPVEDLYNIAEGRVTSPLEAVVKPLVYDAVARKTVEREPIKVVASFRIVMPYDRKTFKPVAPDAENRPFVASYPCYEYLQKAEPSQRVAPSREEPDAAGELPRFSEAQMQALEGVGISRDRLYYNQFNGLSVAEKRDILAGRVFDATGIVRIADGTGDSRLSINVNGKARMDTRRDGEVVMKYETQYPVEMKAGELVDIMRVRCIGNLELDFFERDARGHIKRDVYDNPVVNRAAKDLMRYGYCFGGVDGYIHEKAYNKQSGQWEESRRKEKYQVSLVNGGLCVTRMNRVMDLDVDGNQMKTVIGGVEVDKFHYEVRDARVSADGTVRVGTQSLAPATPKDLDDYRRGLGGCFRDFEYVDRTVNPPKTTVYDAFVVPDNRRGGFAKAFSQKVSKELIERREPKAARRQNFAMGL